jgi:ketosteroid isomerase-like protein
MKKILMWCLLGSMALAGAAWAQTKTETGSTEKAITALEMQWLKGQKTNSPDLVLPLVADKAVFTDSDGKVTGKAEIADFYKKTKWDSADYSDLKVTVAGNAAAATGTFTGKGTGADGKPFDEHERFTDSWAKMPSGKWQCIASHTSRIKM